MAKVAGTAYFKVNGLQYSIRGNMTIALGGVERESVVGLDGYHGIKETPVAAFIECDITTTADLDIATLQRAENVTVTAELSNGKVAVLYNAYQVNNLEIDAVEGQLTARFEGPRGIWL